MNYTRFTNIISRRIIEFQANWSFVMKKLSSSKGEYKSYDSDWSSFDHDQGDMPTKGMSRKQARRFSSRKRRSKNRPRSPGE